MLAWRSQARGAQQGRPARRDQHHGHLSSLRIQRGSAGRRGGTGISHAGRKCGGIADRRAYPDFETAGRESFARLIETVKLLQNDGYFRRGRPLLTAFAVWSALHGLVNLYREDLGPESDQGDEPERIAVSDPYSGLPILPLPSATELPQPEGSAADYTMTINDVRGRKPSAFKSWNSRPTRDLTACRWTREIC